MRNRIKSICVKFTPGLILTAEACPVIIWVESHIKQIARRHSRVKRADLMRLFKRLQGTINISLIDPAVTENGMGLGDVRAHCERPL